MPKIKVAVAGCIGKMGQELVKQILINKNLLFVGGFEHKSHPLIGKKISEVTNIKSELIITANSESLIKNSDVFITPTYGDRLDVLANEYYDDTSLWWIIAQANGIKGFTSLYTKNFKGELRIPTQIQDILSEFESMNG